MNRLENLPNDLIWKIYRKLHNDYMFDLKEELYEMCLEYEWRKENNLGDDFDEDWEIETETDTDSNYSYTDSE